MRRATKPILMPLLMLWYVFSAAKVSPLIIIALFCGCLGDIFLLWAEKRAQFFFGLTSFSFGHVCYILFLLARMSVPPLWMVLALVAAYGTGAAFTYWGLRPALPRTVRPVAAGYMLLLCFMSACTAVYAFGGHGILPLAGSLLFLLSDTILSNEVFKKETRYGNFLVMFTYLAAQLLLTLGFAAA